MSVGTERTGHVELLVEGHRHHVEVGAQALLHFLTELGDVLVHLHTDQTLGGQDDRSLVCRAVLLGQADAPDTWSAC
jgi:hypothetical protein